MKFKDFLYTHFGIKIPKEYVLVKQKNTIRVYSKTLMQISLKGFNGFVAATIKNSEFNIKNEFIQFFGHLANKNIVSVDLEEAKKFVNGGFNLKNKDGYYIIKYGRHVLGICKVKNRKTIIDFVGKGRKRVLNKIKP